MNRIFVYGTLRKGIYNYNKYLLNKSIYIGLGYIKGNIYKIENQKYPAYLPNDSYMIPGEIFEVEDSVLSEVDSMECYYHNDEYNSEYIRRKITIYNEDGKKIDELPVYVYNKGRADRMGIVLEEFKEKDFTKVFTDI